MEEARAGHAGDQSGILRLMTEATRHAADEGATSDREPPAEPAEKADNAPAKPREIGGRKGPDPVRYGDWEKNGRCIDF